VKKVDGLITAKELARILGLSASLVYKRARQGRVTGMVELDDREKYKHRLFRADSTILECGRRKSRE